MKLSYRRNHLVLAAALAVPLACTAATASAQVPQPGQSAQGEEQKAQQQQQQQPPPQATPTEPKEELPYRTVVSGPLREEELVGDYRQPRYTTRRRFPNTRIYVVPAGAVVLEWWLEGKFALGEDKDERWRSQYELEFGLGHRLQLDIYLTTEQLGEKVFALHEEKVELRYALADWGVIPGNPTLYVEAVRQNDGPYKGELKALFGGPLIPRMHWGVNLVYEREFGGADEQEYAITGGVAYSVRDNRFSAGAEVKLEMVDVEGDRFAFDTYEVLAGPSIQWLPVPRIHVDLVALLGFEREPGDTTAVLQPLLVVGGTL